MPQLKLEVYEHGALIDGMTRVSQVSPYKRMFPEGNIYNGGIALDFNDYTLEQIQATLKEHNITLPVVFDTETHSV